MAREAMKLVANNKKAYHDYFIEEKYECGIELFGTEVKSIRMGKCSIKEAYVSIDHGEAFIEGMNISPYENMKRAISSTVSPCANAACSCTRERSSSWPARSRPRAIP